jgi:hypothetical protein
MMFSQKALRVNMVRTLRKAGLRAEEVATYIGVGRSHVLNNPYFDKYAYYQASMLATRAIVRDAMIIASWFNHNRKKWSDTQLEQVYEDIVAIQRGPSHYYRELLRRNLTEQEFSVAHSWASRESIAPKCVSMGALPNLHTKLLQLLQKRACIKMWGDERLGLGQVLVFAFYGLPSADGDGSFNL